MKVKRAFTLLQRLPVQGGAVMTMRRCLLLFLCAGALAGCGRGERDVEALDRDLVGNVAEQTDPALTAALEDQIMVDPALTQQASDAGARAAGTPLQAQIPAGLAPGGAGGERPALGEIAARHGGPSVGDCYAALAYSHGWANRLPPGVPLPRDAAVDEAAGNDAPGCRTRVVSYATASPAPALVAFYLAQARRAGWSADHARRGGDEVVAGERGGAAFYVAITPAAAGSSVNIVASGG